MATQSKKIGDRIRELRKMEGLNQGKFALELGIKGGYVSTLERHKNEPSEQLILNICRAFGVSYEWIKNGVGKKYVLAQLTPRGHSLLEEIIREIESQELKFSFSELAQLLNIDPVTPSKRLNFKDDFYEAISRLIIIFRDGDPSKIEAILAQLKAFKSKFTIGPSPK